jgi:hypothetical protein
LLTPLNYDAHAVRIAALHALGDTDGLIDAVAQLKQDVPDFDVGILFDAPLPASLQVKVSHLLAEEESPRFKHAVAAILEETGS